MVVLNGLFSQSFFNKVIGDEIGFQSARSYAIGQTHFMNSSTSVLALRNPAQLGFFKEGIKLDLNIMGAMINERKAIDLKDYFGDFLVEGDYVSNNTFNNYNQFGFITNFQLFFMNFGAAVSHGPWSSLNYRYEEEVRGSASFDDGIIGIRDPIEGYHILEHEGVINLTSFGLALSINEGVSIGASFNQFHDGSHDYVINNFSNSEFALDAEFKLELLEEILASKEMYIGKHYIKKEKWIPAINRFQTVVKEYDTTIYVEEALHRLVEIHYKIGLTEESKKYASMLGYNYLSSEWYKRSYQVFNRDYANPVKKINKKGNFITRKFKSLFD